MERSKQDFLTLTGFKIVETGEEGWEVLDVIYRHVVINIYTICASLVLIFLHLDQSTIKMRMINGFLGKMGSKGGGEGVISQINSYRRAFSLNHILNS